MSRNFELLKRAEEERLAHPLAAAAAADTIQAPRPLRPVPTDTRRAAHMCPKDATRPGVPGSAEPEITKLVHNLFILNSIAPPRVVLFSPVVRAQEPNFVAARVAEVLSDQHVGQVCVVDADPQYPSLHAYFNVNNVAGFTSLLGSSQDPVHEFAHGVAGCSLTPLTAGPATRNWVNLLASEAGTERLRELRSQFDFVLICAPPLHEVPGIASFGQRVDGTVLIVEAHDVKRDVALRVKQEWERANTRLLGAVLNNRTFPIPPALYARL
jgi:Mrp family chromosome partitioning ATPase